jgi:ABC-type multidrug transport system fused ATPase/permease subunit
MSLLQICQWLEDTPLGTNIRESAFPYIEGTHVLALALSVGMIIWFDLRLAGVLFRSRPVSEVFNQLRPYFLIGFPIMFISGGLLFTAHATQCYSSNYFRVKIFLIFLAGLNILIFHSTIDRRRDQWDKTPFPPLQARLAGVLSLVFWVSIIAAGRLFAYYL